VPSTPAASNTPHNLRVQIDGSALTLTNNTRIITFSSANSGSSIRGISVYGGNDTATAAYILIQGPNTSVNCNYIGVAADGTTVPTNRLTVGLHYLSASADNGVVQNNLISGAKSVDARFFGTTLAIWLQHRCSNYLRRRHCSNSCKRT